MIAYLSKALEHNCLTAQEGYALSSAESLLYHIWTTIKRLSQYGLPRSALSAIKPKGKKNAFREREGEEETLDISLPCKGEGLFRQKDPQQQMLDVGWKDLGLKDKKIHVHRVQKMK